MPLIVFIMGDDEEVMKQEEKEEKEQIQMELSIFLIGA